MTVDASHVGRDEAGAEVPAPGTGPGSGPVFIAGPDRSGTTLLFALLASHPDLSMVRRTNMWRYFHGRYGDLSVLTNLDRALSDMVRYRRMRHLRPDAERIREEFLRREPTYGSLFALFHEHNAERSGKSRWGDKSLHTEHFADRVFAEFPHARIIHLVRDPRDRYASVRKRYGRDLSRVGAATGRWIQSTRAGLRNQARYPGRYLLLRYENLARAPETTMRVVCDFIRLPFSDDMLLMTGVPDLRERGGNNSSFGDLDPGTISTRAIGRFRRILSPAEIRFIELFARGEMTTLGYQRDGHRLSGTALVRFYARDLPHHLVRMVVWRTRAWLRRRRGIRVPRHRLGAEGVRT